MEHDFVRWLSSHLPSSRRLRPGIGDDAALVALDTPQVVATADLLIEGVHFLSAKHTPSQIGYKALAVNLSDLAAMAAQPRGALVSLALPRGADPRLGQQIIEGMLPLTERWDCPLVGGDTNTGPGPLVVAVTALGEPSSRGVVLRSGAQPGDVLCVTGPLGGSLAGKHLDFTPRVSEALALHAAFSLHAMLDISDGLALDLHRMAVASGVGALLYATAIPLTPAAHQSAAASGRTALDHALADGEDFELLFALPPEEAARLQPGVFPQAYPVGVITAEPGLWLEDADGVKQPLQPMGYEHQ
ncbi:thiamine-phosphate kinase [Botrimarina hoheduenensis]|uniref:Thiamine-monophosphate kinase n=1 Tax=Botrimarina hoheduenensis TaxID=2528000 RepID=A0A5C5WCP7_9BACT|nr:thiamine-phosphate kinase [Botrimarina hoheduenensis]TWT48450.1 Thiamine-monophosphate kinase [Botrimarina hoheduenensis]